MDNSTTSVIYHALSETWLRVVAPLCAAAGLKLQADPGFCTGPETVVCELATFSGVSKTYQRGRIFLIGDSSQAQAMFSAATGTAAQVVLLPEAGDWLANQLAGPRDSTRGTVSIFSGAVGGAGCSSAAVLAGMQQAQRGRRVLVIDGTARPTPQVGSSHYLPVPLTCQGQWDAVLTDEELPSIVRLVDFLPQQTYDGGGSLFWLGAAHTPQVLPLEKLSTVVEHSAEMFQQVVVDVGDPYRAGQLAGERHILVSPISERADAACHHLHSTFPQWELVLNGAASAGWSPERFRQLADHRVLGRIKPLRLMPENVARVALRKDVPELLGAVKNLRRARTESQQPVEQPEPAVWLPQLPSRSVFAQLLSRAGVSSV